MKFLFINGYGLGFIILSQSLSLFSKEYVALAGLVER